MAQCWEVLEELVVFYPECGVMFCLEYGVIEGMLSRKDTGHESMGGFAGIALRCLISVPTKRGVGFVQCIKSCRSWSRD